MVMECKKCIFSYKKQDSHNCVPHLKSVIRGLEKKLEQASEKALEKERTFEKTINDLKEQFERNMKSIREKFDSCDKYCKNKTIKLVKEVSSSCGSCC